MYQLVIFDLDGTINNPQGVLQVFQTLCEQYKVRQEPVLAECIGPPVQVTFSKFFSEHDQETLVAQYREQYRTHGIYQDKLYDGISELLLALKNRTVALATSKPKHLATKVLDYNNISSHFDYIVGGEIAKGSSSKTNIVKQVLEHYPQISKEHMVMVGDKVYDIQAARENGIDSIYVHWGHGDKEEGNQATHQAKTIKELKKILEE